MDHEHDLAREPAAASDATDALTIVHQPRKALLVRAIAPIRELMEAQKEITSVVTELLTENTDYGVIPGTKKQTLFKAGAERVARAFGCVATYTIIDSEAMHDEVVTVMQKNWYGVPRGGKPKLVSTEVVGLYRYVVQCDLLHVQSGTVVGYGIGSCSTVESKYQDRPRELENTIVKMACKRAHVAAVLNAFALSDRFTQDMEDGAPQEDEAAADQQQARGRAASKPAEVSKPKGSADSVATLDPAKTLPPDAHELAGTPIGEWTAEQLAYWRRFMAERPRFSERYPVFCDALASVASASTEAAAATPTTTAEVTDGQATD